MKAFYLYLILLFFVCWGSSELYAQDSSLSKVILLRHAEKADSGNNPALSEQGKQRALKVAEMFSAMPIHAFYSTPYLRTRETILALAEAKQQTVQDYGALNFEEIKKNIAKHAGQNIIFSAHSNTLAPILKALTGKSYPEVSELDYGNIWILTFKADKLLDVMHLRY